VIAGPRLPSSLAVIGEGITTMTTSLERAEQRLASLPKDEQASRRALLGRVVDAVLERPLTELAPLVDALVEPPADEEDRCWSLAEARTRNLERRFADQSHLARTALSASVVRGGLNVSRQRLHQLVTQGRLVAIQLQPGAPGLFPTWQFAPGIPVRPIAGLSHLLDAAREAELDALMLHFFMIEPNERMRGRTPAELVAAGELDRVIDVLTSTGLGPL